MGESRGQGVSSVSWARIHPIDRQRFASEGVFFEGVVKGEYGNTIRRWMLHGEG